MNAWKKNLLDVRGAGKFKRADVIAQKRSRMLARQSLKWSSPKRSGVKDTAPAVVNRSMADKERDRKLDEYAFQFDCFLPRSGSNSMEGFPGKNIAPRVRRINRQ